MTNRRRTITVRLPDLITIVMLPLLWLTIDTGRTQQNFQKYDVLATLTMIVAFSTALMAVFNTAFEILSRWTALITGLLAFSRLEAMSRGLEAAVPAIYLVLLLFLPRASFSLEGEALDPPPPTVSATSNFSGVFHKEPAQPLGKKDLWKRPLYTAERVRRNWTLRLARRPFPRLTLALILAAVAVFIVGWHASPGGLRRVVALWHALYPPALAGTTASGWWSALTGTALVWSVGQLIVHGLVLFWLGRALEPTLGRPRFAAYLLVGAAAGVVGGALRPDAMQLGTAAIGAVYAAIGVYFAIIAIHFRLLDLDGKQRAFGLAIIGVFVAVSVGTSSLSVFSPVNHMAAFVGLLAGVLLVLVAGPHFAAIPDPANPIALTVQARSVWQR